MSHIINSDLYGDGFSTAEMRDVFADERRLQRWLDVEVALARVQARLGVIPAEAAEEIAAHAHVEGLDLVEIAAEIKRTDHSLVPLLGAVQRRCRANLGEYIHYGATTQDIQDTASVLEMRDVLDIVRRDLKTIAGTLADLAETHRETVMAGRTHGQQAMATTFGYKVSIWLREVLRHLVRLQQARPRILVVSLFGGVGTMSALPRGVETMAGVAAELGLDAADVSWHTARDAVAEHVTLMAMITATLGKIGNEIYTLAKNEFGELAEAHAEGRLGSSTMPHKRNPETAEQVALLARLSKYASSQAIEAMVVEHDRDARAWRVDWVAIPEVSCFAAAALSATSSLLDGLEVNAERMAANLAVKGDFLASECLMMALGEKLGKQTAHHVVYQAAMAAHATDAGLVEVLVQSTEVIECGEADRLQQLADPRHQLGAAVALTDAAVARSRVELESL